MAHSLFVVGAGRNGTSMTAGLFRNCGLNMGGQLHAPSPENPKGYFEAAPVNQLNNRILGALNPAREVIDGLPYRADSPGMTNGWLSRIPLGAQITCTPDQSAEIRQILATRPFCIKDTRFCYLLHLWRHEAPEARMICVFRRPEVSAASILNSLRLRPGLHDMALSVNQAFQIWTLMYQHVLDHQAQSGEWLFVDYDDVLNGTALGALARFSGHEVDADFPTRQLNRTQPEFQAPADSDALHARLMARARQDLDRYS